MATSGPIVVSWKWNQFQTGVSVTRRVGENHHRVSTFAHDRYLELSAIQHTWTMAPQLARNLVAAPGRRISRQKINSRLAETGLYARYAVRCVPFDCSELERLIIAETK
ncbi:hypothetical protein TNCV_3774691 [Trichonephila clavipes]|nr:hypothetical protein TNCV_3774691 [Trichonephila clavipes]